MLPVTKTLPQDLEEVLSHYAVLVRSVGRRHGLADADLDEIVQDVRVRLWRAQGSNETIGLVTSSYVYRTARSAALDLVRRRRDGREEPLEDRVEGTAAAGPEMRLERKELGERIGRALNTLGATRRPVVRMYLAGYSGNEIAKVLGWSEAKTRNLLYRGLADLRASLTRAGIGPEGMR
jgi:RNA polymerase sigma factor (sigma-70 family)